MSLHTFGKADTMTLNTQFRASFVRRWHTNPDLVQTVDTLAGHGERAALELRDEINVALQQKDAGQ